MEPNPSAQMLADFGSLGHQRLTQDFDGMPRFAGPTHEDVERRIIELRLSVQRNVGFRQHRDAGHTVILAEMVELNIQ